MIWMYKRIYSELGLKLNLSVSSDTWFQIAMRTGIGPKGPVCKNLFESGFKFIWQSNNFVIVSSLR